MVYDDVNNWKKLVFINYKLIEFSQDLKKSFRFTEFINKYICYRYTRIVHIPKESMNV